MVSNFELSEMKATVFQLFSIALLVRIVFIVVGIYLDSSGGGLQYTDIDYHVFSDAAEFVSKGMSPYERSTYRYPPVLALLLVPNVFLSVFGKILFSIADAAIIFELQSLLDQFDPQYSNLYCWLWVFNIASINICTRGSADSITNYLVLLSLRLVLCSKPSRPQNELVGVVLGVLVYLRVYPIIYLPAYVFYGIVTNIQAHRYVAKGRVRYEYLTCIGSILYNTTILLYTITVTLALLMAISYHYYGDDYLQNAVLYHLSREDHRQNFSVHFYGIYLSKYTNQTYSQHMMAAFSQYIPSITGGLSNSGCTVGSIGAGDGGVCGIDLNSVVGVARLFCAYFPSVVTLVGGFLPSLLLFIPQLLIFSALIITFAPADLPLCLLLQTIIFVSYNKVITAQYFSWYMCLLPVCMRTIRAIPTKLMLFVSALWGGALAYWLYTAYLLEFTAQSTYYQVWVASLIFHVATAAVVCTIVSFA